MTYFDHAASSPLRHAVKQKMTMALDSVGNPLSVHAYGRKAKELLNEARDALADFIHCEPQNIIFNSSATEGNNQALLCQGADVVLAMSTEHNSVRNVHPHTQFIPVDSNGVVNLVELDKMLSQQAGEKILVAVMMVNNETGTIQPIHDVAALAKKYGALFHCDAVQGLGKVTIDFNSTPCDTMSFSAHKIGGPQGVGALVVKNHVALSPHIKGSAQERNLRAGTHNLISIAGFGAAVSDCNPQELQRMDTLRKMMEERLLNITPEAVIHAQHVSRVPSTTYIGLRGRAAETQVINMDLKGIAISAGAACSSGKTNKRSHVLHAMGLDDDIASSSVRISLGWSTTEKDVDVLTHAWQELYGSQELNKKKVNG